MVLALTRLWKREILQKAGGTCLRNRFPEMFSLQGSILKRLVFYSPSQYSRYSQKSCTHLEVFPEEADWVVRPTRYPTRYYLTTRL